jgi:anti-anti-sigma factor
MSTTLSPMTALTQLHIDTSWPSPAVARMVVVGEVDLATAHLLRDRVLDLLREQTPAVVDVDLAGVTFLDCTGISALVAVRAAALRVGGRMRVSHPQPIVRRLLDVTGLLGIFTAPIDQPQPPPARSGHESMVGPTPATATQPPGVLVAA